MTEILTHNNGNHYLSFKDAKHGVSTINYHAERLETIPYLSIDAKHGVSTINLMLNSVKLFPIIQKTPSMASIPLTSR